MINAEAVIRIKKRTTITNKKAKIIYLLRNLIGGTEEINIETCLKETSKKSNMQKIDNHR